MMTAFSSHFGPEEEYVLASLATGLRTFLDATDDSIIRKISYTQVEPGQNFKRLVSSVDPAESASALPSGNLIIVMSYLRFRCNSCNYGHSTVVNACLGIYF